MRGKALHIGVNDYPGSRDSDTAEKDAVDLWTRSKAANFEPLVGDGTLLGRGALYDSVLKAIEHASDLEAGDYLLVTFSGMGALPRFNAPYADDRAWLLADGPLPYVRLIDSLRKSVRDGVRVFLMSTCCYSGPRDGDTGVRVRAVSEADASAMFREFSGRFALGSVARIQTLPARHTPSIIHMSACGLFDQIDDGSAPANSPFVRKVLALLDDGARRTFSQFVEAIHALDRQTPRPRLEPSDPRAREPFESVGPFILA